MSGKDVKARAEVAKGSGAAHGAEPTVTIRANRWKEIRPRLPLGRPPGITDIIDPEPLRSAIREMRRNRVRITQGTVSGRSGFSVAAIRGYLKRTYQTWAEFLRTF